MEENKVERATMKMLPGDEVRQIMWRFAERYDIQMAVAGARQTARSVVARLVANGQRFTHEWTAEKQSLFDDVAVETPSGNGIENTFIISKSELSSVVG